MREDAKLSREKLARLADVSISTINRMELDGHVPGGETIKRIALALGTTTDLILEMPAQASPALAETRAS